MCVQTYKWLKARIIYNSEILNNILVSENFRLFLCDFINEYQLQKLFTAFHTKLSGSYSDCR
jgi:hypothetical protein